MATRKHAPTNSRGHAEVVQYMIEAGWDHPYVKEYYAKQRNSRQAVRNDRGPRRSR